MRRLAVAVTVFIGLGCRRSYSTIPKRTASQPAPPTASAPPVTSSTRDQAGLTVPTIAEPAPDPQVELTAEQLRALRKKFPHATVQSAVRARTRSGQGTLALIWEKPPVAEDRCPPEGTWNAWDTQSCAGFNGAHAGPADLVRFQGDSLSESVSLAQFFQHDANPSGVERNGRRGSRHAFVQPSYRIELHDLNGDGFAAEVLFHIGNGPYAIVEGWGAVGVFQDHLEIARTVKSSPISVSQQAWLDLARTGRGVSDLYCGARCGNTATRQVLERGPNGRVVKTDFWSCDPDGPWNPGSPPADSCRQ